MQKTTFSCLLDLIFLANAVAVVSITAGLGYLASGFDDNLVLSLIIGLIGLDLLRWMMRNHRDFNYRYDRSYSELVRTDTGQTMLVSLELPSSQPNCTGNLQYTLSCEEITWGKGGVYVQTSIWIPKDCHPQAVYENWLLPRLGRIKLNDFASLSS
ncbi:MAG: hypothetical protein WCO52_01950 [bacterium]